MSPSTRLSKPKVGWHSLLYTMLLSTEPNVFLRYWLTRLGLNPERDVEIMPMGEDKVVAAAVAG
jgi:ABC-type nitrate/sulfonate/bicarbonate transport system substrate-binding protein